MSHAFQDQVVFLTGASSGIGEALARELSRQGARVALAARRTDRIEALATELGGSGQPCLAVTCDVTSDESVNAAVASVRARFGRIDVVVANAGFGVIGNVARLSLDDFRRQFETNLFGALRTAYATLDDLKSSRGTLVLVGSVSAYLSAPGTAAYAMSKHALRVFAEHAREELRPHGVAVVLISPGFVESEIRTVNNRGVISANAKDPIPRFLQMPRDVAARKIARAIASRQRERILTIHGRVAIFLARHAPWLIRAILRLGPAWESP